MFNMNNTNNTVNQCQLVIAKACAMAVRTCVSFNASVDRRLFVQIEAAMLLRLSSHLNAGMSAQAALEAAEQDVPDFDKVFSLNTLATAECGKFVYAQAKYALMQRLGKKAMVAFFAKAA